MNLRCILAVGGLLATLLTATIAQAQTPPSTSQLEVPNVFTPNGDGQNDTFSLESTQPLKLYVYSRTGTQVSYAEGRRIVWDGRNELGHKLSDGIYFYTLDDPANTYKQKKGFVYLLRADMKRLK